MLDFNYNMPLLHLSPSSDISAKLPFCDIEHFNVIFWRKEKSKFFVDTEILVLRFFLLCNH